MSAKKLACILLLILSSLVYAGDLAINQDGVAISTSEQSIAKDGLNLSYALLDTSVKLATIASNTNELNQGSMLQLSQDIGTMADRINTMADKIVATQSIESANLEMTEKNMLSAQKNLLSALQNTNNVSIEKNLQKAKSTLGDAIEKEQVNIDIASSKSMDELISKMSTTSHKYRYKYMNAIKENIYGMDKQMREEAFENVLAKIEDAKSSAQKDMDSEKMSSMSSPSSIGGMGDADGIGGMDGMGGMGGMGGSDAGGSAGGMF